MNKEVENAIKVLENYIVEKKKEIERLSKLVEEAKGNNPLIDNGYFKIISYSGMSEKIKVGTIYKGRTFFSEYSGTKRGVINKPKAYFSEKNASWIISCKEEYKKGKKGDNG